MGSAGPWIGALTAFAFVNSCFAAAADAINPEFATGELIEKVVCKNDASQSYALYLPKAYTTEKQWPILYGFGWVGRGRSPVQSFMAAAEKYGWILVSGNNARTADAVVRDTAARFSIDEKRRYAAGFSGWAGTAYLLAGGKDHPFAGMILCGSLPPDLPAVPREVNEYLLASNKDHAGYLAVATEEYLSVCCAQKRHCCLAVFDGDHPGPPAEFCAAAIRHMELLWQMQHGRAGDPSVTEALRQDIAFIEKQSHLHLRCLRNHDCLADLTKLAKGSALEKEVAARLSAFEATPRYKMEKAADEASQEIDAETVKIPDEGERVKRIVARHAKLIAEFPGSEAAATAEEVLRTIRRNGIAFARDGEARLKSGNFKDAALCLQQAHLYAPEDVNLAYKLACAQAQAGQREQALKSLKEAVDLGFRDRECIRTDAALGALRETEEYKQLIAALDARGANP